jgi:manganese transport protein
MWVKVLGWVSVLALTFLNMKGLPDNITSFFGANPSASTVSLAHTIAYVLIAAIVALLIWTIYDLYQSRNKMPKRIESTEEHYDESKED